MTRSSGKRWLRTLALFLLLLAAARFTDCSPTLFWARRSHLTDLISAMLPPDWGYAPRILAPLLATVQMSVTGTALGSFLALLLAPLCAENLHAPKPLRWTLRLLVQVLQQLELEHTLRIHPAVRLFRLLLLLRMFFHSMLLYTSSFLTSLIERNRNSFSGFFI